MLRRLIVYFPITKRWPTGERAGMDNDQMMFEVEDGAREEMLIAGLKQISIPSQQILGSGRRVKNILSAASLIQLRSRQVHLHALTIAT